MKTTKYGTGKAKKICFVVPRHPKNFWTMKHMTDVLGNKTLMTNTAFPLLMALTPPEVCVEYILMDENTSEIDWNVKCDLVAITGYTLHLKRMKEIADHFKKRSIPVAIGGPHVSINPHDCEAYADFLFVGESEYLWPQFLKDWMKGEAKPQYIQKDPVNIKDNPPVDWSLIKKNDYLTYAVQVRRGCQYNCDFCDVIRLHGRKVRYKTIEQVMVELKEIYAQGAEQVFFLDDNFNTRRSFTKDLLREIVKWNKDLKHPLAFIAQTTIEIAKDEEMLKLFADARLYQVFVGVETSRTESLLGTNKAHNVFGDMRENIKLISSYGIIPIVGLMVGFDQDDTSIFAEQELFLQEAGSPITAISVMNAPRDTPLYHRLKAEGRVIGDDFKGEWQFATNVIPKLMTVKELISGYHKLFKKVYEMDAFEERFISWVNKVKYTSDIYKVKKKRIRDNSVRFPRLVFHLIFKAGKPMRDLFIRGIKHTIKVNPKLMRQSMNMLLQYMHFSKFVNQKEWQESNELSEMSFSQNSTDFAVPKRIQIEENFEVMEKK